MLLTCLWNETTEMQESQKFMKVNIFFYLKILKGLKGESEIVFLVNHGNLKSDTEISRFHESQQKQRMVLPLIHL